MPPSLIADRYHVLRELGRGGMGAVYEAVQEPIERKVAGQEIQVAAPAEPQAQIIDLMEALKASLAAPAAAAAPAPAPAAAAPQAAAEPAPERHAPQRAAPAAGEKSKKKSSSRK